MPTIVFHGDRDTTVHPNNGERVLNQSAKATSPTTRVLRGRVPHGHAYTRTSLTDAAGGWFPNTGTFMAAATHGREAVPPAPIPTRGARSDEGNAALLPRAFASGPWATHGQLSAIGLSLPGLRR